MNSLMNMRDQVLVPDSTKMTKLKPTHHSGPKSIHDLDLGIEFYQEFFQANFPGHPCKKKPTHSKIGAKIREIAFLPVKQVGCDVS